VEQNITASSAFVTAPYSAVTDWNFHLLDGKSKVHYHVHKSLYRDKSSPHPQLVFKRWTVETPRVRLPVSAGDFPLLRNVQTTSGAHPVDTEPLSLGVKRPGREGDHSPPSTAEVKKEWSYTSTPPSIPSWRGQGKALLCFYFYGYLRKKN
jgi:hypothetical protein